MQTDKRALSPTSGTFRHNLLHMGSRFLPHDTRRTTCPPAAVVSGEGPVIIVPSLMRSGTHLLLDGLFNNFPALRRTPLFIDFDAYERGSLPIPPLAAVNGVVIKTHYPQTPLQPAYAATLEQLAGRAVILHPSRPAAQVRNSLAKWNMIMSEEEFAELENRYNDFWGRYSPTVVEFAMLLKPEGMAGFIRQVQQRTGLEPRSTSRPIIAAKTRKGAYIDKILTRMFGCHVPRINTTIGYRLGKKPA
jgi:hypothetical protein